MVDFDTLETSDVTVRFAFLLESGLGDLRSNPAENSTACLVEFCAHSSSSSFGRILALAANAIRGIFSNAVEDWPFSV